MPLEISTLFLTILLIPECETWNMKHVKILSSEMSSIEFFVSSVPICALLQPSSRQLLMTIFLLIHNVISQAHSYY